MSLHVLAIRFLSAGLTTAVVLAAPVMAREISNRPAAEDVNARAAHWVEGHVGVPMPHVRAFIAEPRGSGSCDVGDNPHSC
jgi:hypothetical protein